MILKKSEVGPCHARSGSLAQRSLGAARLFSSSFFLTSHEGAAWAVVSSTFSCSRRRLRSIAACQVSLWVRNVQLGLYSIAIGMAGYYAEVGAMDVKPLGGFFHGYTQLTFANIAVQVHTPNLPPPLSRTQTHAHKHTCFVHVGPA
jgi:hypothetical protein